MLASLQSGNTANECPGGGQVGPDGGGRGRLRQGADRGTQYRSIIFTKSKEEETIAQQVINEVQPYLDNKIVTEVKAYEAFYEAEKYHQGFKQIER